ncbi:Hypothetical protein GLP15_832 [Giardia lamblia P15]|uniref:Uncharacterized protein n=1 Tax=Giardia intestinalis (strain P15) TaxID=658858 RepID=E1F3W4_GIAIA|nr:Hypothetical protein GLP15_832 [Giardia lamblia P15]
MSLRSGKEAKNLCITLPTTTTLLGDEIKSISDNVVVQETALRFLDSASVSPTAKSMQSASSFFRDTMTRDPKSVQSSRRKGDYEIKFVVGAEKDPHRDQLAALSRDQEAEDAKRRKIKRSVHMEQPVDKFNVTTTPFFKAYYKIGAQSGVERISADAVSLPPITSKIQVIKKFTEQSAHTNNQQSLVLSSKKTHASVPDLKHGRISGVLLASAAFQSYNYETENVEKAIDSPSQKVDTIAAYVPNATINDLREMKRIYTQLEELSDGSGYIYCVGGLSFHEIMIRVIAPRKSWILQDELYTFKKGVPFNPVRRKIVALCQQIAFERGVKARELLFDNKVRIYPKSFDDVWPLGVAELITITGISGKYSSIEHVNLPVGYGSDCSIKSSTQAVGTNQNSSRRGQTSQLISQRQTSLNQQNTQVGDSKSLKKDSNFPPVELIYSIQDQLLKHLDSLFLRSVLELIEALKDCGILTNNDPVHIKLLDIYTKHCFNKPPSPVTDPAGTEWVSCHITERVVDGPSFSDIYRYLEGFIMVANWSTLHSGIALDSDECSMLCTKIISPITAALSLCISRFFLHVYVKPLVSVMTEADIKSQIREVTLSKESATVDDLILDLLRREGKALTELEHSKYKNRYYHPFMKRIYTQRKEAIAASYTKEQIHSIHTLVKKLREVSVLPDIVTESGARELIEYVSSVMLNMDMSTLSTSLFRVLRGKFLTKYKSSCAIPTPLVLRKHLAYHVHICILAAKVAAIKVIEEIYPLHVHTHIGRVFEYDALTQIDLIIDPTGVFTSSLNKFISST